MSPKPITIAIAGVNGRLGTLIATELLSSFSNVTVHGFCRSPSKIPDSVSSHPNFKSFQGSAESVSDARQAVQGCSAVICAYLDILNGDWMVRSQQVLIDACEAEGVSRFIPSDYTGDITELEIGAIPPKDPMIKVYRDLLKANEDGTKKVVKGAHVLTGILVETFFEYFFNVKNPEYWGEGDETWDLTTYDVAAKYGAHVAADPEEPTGVLRFREIKTTLKDVVSAINRTQNRTQDNALTLTHCGTMADLKQIVDEVRKTGDWMPNVMQLAIYWEQSKEFQLGDELDNWRYPDVKLRALEEVVKANVS